MTNRAIPGKIYPGTMTLFLRVFQDASPGSSVPGAFLVKAVNPTALHAD
jgi:hypothetical protein